MLAYSVDGYWLNWGNWSHIGQCTVSCGGGNRTEIRTRSCKQAQFGGKPCVGKFNETRDQSCNEQPCQRELKDYRKKKVSFCVPVNM